MHTTRTPFGLHWPIADHDTAARLSWLINTNAADETRLSRAGLNEQIMMMRRPCRPSGPALHLFVNLTSTARCISSVTILLSLIEEMRIGPWKEKIYPELSNHQSERASFTR